MTENVIKTNEKHSTKEVLWDNSKRIILAFNI